MKAPELLHDQGQNLWLDNITRDLLDSGWLKQYIDGLSITGLTSNPTIFDHAIKNSDAHDASIAEKISRGKSGEALFFELALEDPGGRPVPASPRKDERRGRLGVIGSVTASSARHGRYPLCHQRAIGPRESLQPVDQDSWHKGRASHDRRGNFLGRACQWA